MEDLDVCSKPKRARRQNFSIMEMNIIHNEVKANPVLESKFSNVITNQKKQAIWLNITEKVNAVGNTKRTINEVRDKWRNMCRDAKQKFAEHRREAKRTGGGPPPTPLSQTVTEIVDMYKDCSSFVGIPGGMETSISSETENSHCYKTLKLLESDVGLIWHGFFLLASEDHFRTILLKNLAPAYQIYIVYAILHLTSLEEGQQLLESFFFCLEVAEVPSERPF
uniref:Myb/SANT-like DNA-binding domain-containing protein n=1 Tax=Magallana gigas TaxID=29159 RepID=A0A8W8NN17_MAGGI